MADSGSELSEQELAAAVAACETAARAVTAAEDAQYEAAAAQGEAERLARCGHRQTLSRQGACAPVATTLSHAGAAQCTAAMPFLVYTLKPLRREGG